MNDSVFLIDCVGANVPPVFFNYVVFSIGNSSFALLNLKFYNLEQLVDTHLFNKIEVILFKHTYSNNLIIKTYGKSKSLSKP